MKQKTQTEIWLGNLLVNGHLENVERDERTTFRCKLTIGKEVLSNSVLWY